MTPNLVGSENSAKSASGYPALPFRPFEDFSKTGHSDPCAIATPTRWIPPVDIVERDGNLRLMVSLPRLTEKDIELK